MTYRPTLDGRLILRHLVDRAVALRIGHRHDGPLRMVLGQRPEGEYTIRFTPGSLFVGEDGVDEVVVTFDPS